MTPFVRHATLLFLAMRAGDLVNLAAGLWLVPKFVDPADLGAVLPVTSFATLLAMPVFAFAMAVMKESADLAGRDERGKLKSLWRGVFLAIALLASVSMLVSAIMLPRYLKAMRIADASAGFFILAAALLGSVAPVYTDALQAVKRFRSLAAIELSAALLRLGSLAAAMPISAFTGYFAGNAVQPLSRILGSVFALRGDLAFPAAKFWTRQASVRLAVRFALILLYLAIAMLVANCEQNLIRERLPSVDSAGYYMATRLSDVMNYLTLPLILVLFPYAAEATRQGRSTLPLVLKSSLVTLAAAALLGAVYAKWGATLISLLPHGSDYLGYLDFLPMLLAIGALGTCQTIYTNAEVAAGRFRFLWWFVPVECGCLAMLGLGHSLAQLLTLFLLGAILRTCGCVVQEAWRHLGVVKNKALQA